MRIDNHSRLGKRRSVTNSSADAKRNVRHVDRVADPGDNHVAWPIVTCAASDFVTTLTTDSPTYNSGQTVTINATITNASSKNCDNLTGWLVNIRFPNGSLHEVTYLAGGAEVPGAHFPPGDTRSATESWNDDSSPSGRYTVIWDWSSGTPHAVQQADFTIA